jgi:hypothetical protein
MRNQWLWIMVRYAVPVVVNHGVLCWISGCELLCAMFLNHGVLYWACESSFVMLCLWFWVMVNYAEPLVVNHRLLCCAKGCESWCVMLSQWLWIMVCYPEPVAVNHDMWLWIMIVCNVEPVVVNYGLLYRTCGCDSWCVTLSQCVWAMVCSAELMVVNHCVLYGASGCESWCAMLS